MEWYHVSLLLFGGSKMKIDLIIFFRREKCLIENLLIYCCQPLNNGWCDITSWLSWSYCWWHEHLVLAFIWLARRMVGQVVPGRHLSELIAHGIRASHFKIPWHNGQVEPKLPIIIGIEMHLQLKQSEVYVLYNDGYTMMGDMKLQDKILCFIELQSCCWRRVLLL